MSGGRMQTSNFGSKHQHRRRFRQVVRRLSIGQAVDHFQRALLNLELFGPGVGAILSLFLLISIFHQGAHSGAEKGVI
jgi:hypothetical protein